MSALGQKQTFAVHQPMSALPPIATAKADMPQMIMSALHPIADMCSALAHVCFGPKADIPIHSITSSARASTAGGTVRPSALAVLRLIARSYLVGVCTGRSAGFSPLRMRST
jgi:hypothetical protein